MEQQDASGTMRSLEEVEEAITEVSKLLINPPLEAFPRLILAAPTILDCLKMYRRVLIHRSKLKTTL